MSERSEADSVVMIDCHYVAPEIAAAFLLLEDDRAAFVDNNTARATPYLLQALDDNGVPPEAVEYLVVTHVHLDHAGGTAALLEHCPHATVLCHPRAARHLINPKRLVASALQVYSKAVFEHLFGEIHPVPEARVRTVEDGATVAFGSRVLRFLDTPGHARHHLCMHDSASNGVFAGDCFGLYYPSLQTGFRPLITCSSTPTEFEPVAARRTVERIIETGAERVYVTHFGVVEEVAAAAEALVQSIDAMERIMKEASMTQLEGDALEAFCLKRVREDARQRFVACGIDPSPDNMERLDADVVINARGLAYQANRLRRASG